MLRAAVERPRAAGESPGLEPPAASQGRGAGPMAAAPSFIRSRGTLRRTRVRVLLFPLWVNQG